MPATTYHVALAGLLAIPLLGRYFDIRAFAVVAAATAFPDIDGVFEIWWTGAHRTLLHNLWIPVLLTSAFTWDVYLRDRSYLRRRWGDRGTRVAGTAIVALALAAVMADAFYNGANLLWPLRDQFYKLTGAVYYSTEEGVVVEALAPEAIGQTSEIHLRTGVDMTPGDDPAGIERVFVFAEDGQQLLLTLLGYAAVAYTLVLDRCEDDEQKVQRT